MIKMHEFNSAEQAFADFLKALPVGFSFSRWNLEGGVRFVESERPRQHRYDEMLNAGLNAGLIEQIGPDKYTRTEKRVGSWRSLVTR